MKGKGRPAKISRSPVGTGTRICEAREAIDMTQSALAQAIGVNQQTIAFWEREAPVPKAEYLPLLAETLNVSLDYLLMGSEVKQKRKPGPESKLGKCFSEVSSLPKNQQEKIIDVVDALVSQTRVR